MKSMMTRTVKHNVRYYLLEVTATLFDEWIMIRTWGSCANARPTGIIKKSYPTLQEAKTAMEEILHEKYKRGYVCAQH
ncbi:MAG: WGR domain-containing protein [Epsilonproteobacteria bacterium]|jgi:predicted DNA-binding WGR domain protein|nr:WGR domain-containing protein [Campylobacterota bacterium]